MKKKFNTYGILGVDQKDLIEIYKQGNKYDELMDILIDLFLEYYFDSQTKFFLTNCEVGTSMLCAEIIANFMRYWPRDVYLYSILPFENREKKLPVKYRKRYKKLVKSCNITAYLRKDYKKGCVFRTETLVIRECNVIFAICNLKNTSRLAMLINVVFEKDKRLIILDIDTLNIITFY